MQLAPAGHKELTIVAQILIFRRVLILRMRTVQ